MNRKPLSPLATRPLNRLLNILLLFPLPVVPAMAQPFPGIAIVNKVTDEKNEVLADNIGPLIAAVAKTARQGETPAAPEPQRKRAATFDAAKGVEVIDIGKNGEGKVARMTDKGWFRFNEMNLAEVTHLTLRVAPLTMGTFDIEVHLGAPDGPLLGTNFVACLTEKDSQFGEFTIPVQPPAGLQTVYVVSRIALRPLYKRDFPPPVAGKLLEVV